jgi:hypothetical protein
LLFSDFFSPIFERSPYWYFIFRVCTHHDPHPSYSVFSIKKTELSVSGWRGGGTALWNQNSDISRKTLCNYETRRWNQIFATQSPEWWLRVVASVCGGVCVCTGVVRRCGGGCMVWCGSLSDKVSKEMSQCYRLPNRARGLSNCYSCTSHRLHSSVLSFVGVNVAKFARFVCQKRTFSSLPVWCGTHGLVLRCLDV